MTNMVILPNDMTQIPDYLALDDDALLAQCDLHTYKSSGPGGQHRNKVSSAVRLKHRPTGISAHGDDSRSQHDNKALAIKRLRMNIACTLRRPIARGPAGAGTGAGPADDANASAAPGVGSAPPLAPLPAYVRECMFVARGGERKGTTRLNIGPKDHRFWHVAAFVLDVLESFEARLSDAAGYLGISTGNLSSLIVSDRHLFGAAQAIRKRHGLKPLD